MGEPQPVTVSRIPPADALDPDVLDEIVRRVVEVAAPDRIVLFGVGAPVDVIVASPEQVERYRDTHTLVIEPAIREGRVVYDAD